MVLMGRRSGRRSDLIEAYAICKDITKAASTSFLRSFRHLPLEKRNAVYALYAFCRRVDDIADGDWLPDLSGIGPEEMSDLDARTVDRSVILSIDKQSEGSNPEPDHSLKLRALIHFRDMLTRAHEGHSVSDPIFVALKDTFNRFPIRVSDLHQLIDGMEDDLYPTNYRSFEDLRGYCYKVASTVGLSLIEIYGYENPDAREHAEEMGIFLQMVNILRDIQEDLGRGRGYLPKDELELFGIS
ncbi:MAG TPA: phytoene/squalene synthase family protein, partial [Candidatus Thalassarchaeaceae archaeon]